MTKVIGELETHRTRKTRYCELCGGEIGIGEKYVTACLVDGGLVWHSCEHLQCHNIMEKECDACDETCRDECFDSDCFVHAIEAFVCPFCDVVKDCRILNRLKCDCARSLMARLYGEEDDKK